MIYPLLPLFLTGVFGASPFQLGLVEGVAEATASILKVVSGFVSDRLGKKRGIILLGYSLSGLVRPLMGLAYAWPMVLAVRFADRIGKGIRTSPRDALISQVTPEAFRGRAFGIHRAMDHAGAVCGPVVAGLLLALPGFDIRRVFFAAFIPAVATIGVLGLFLREPESIVPPAPPLLPGRLTALRSDWKRLHPGFKRLLVAVFIFGLGNSADAFLLVHLARNGVSSAQIAILWSAHNLIKMVSTYWGGKFADYVGPRTALLLGWLYFGAIYLGLGWGTSQPVLVALFLAYGVYFGLVEPAERAWVAKMVSTQDRGKAYGFFHLAVGLSALPASIVFGLLWETFGTQAAFSVGAALSFLACGLFWFEIRTDVTPTV